MLMPEDVMEELIAAHTQRILEAVAKHLENHANGYTSPVVAGSWLAAADEVRALATDVQFDAITGRIQP